MLLPRLFIPFLLLLDCLFLPSDFEGPAEFFRRGWTDVVLGQAGFSGEDVDVKDGAE